MLLVAAMIRNEAGRFLQSALEAWSSFADKILVLDDGSTDNSPQIAEPLATVIRRDGPEAWGNESAPRQQLFNLAIQHTQPGDWIMILDGDMCPARSPRPLMDSTASDAWSFCLFDLWESGRYRDDGFWRGHLFPRVWMIKRPLPQGWLWSGRGLHCGHLPLNLPFKHVSVAPYDMGLLHMAYSDESLRQEKAAAYASQSHQLTEFERAHASSILDPNPRLVPLYFTPSYELRRA